jgi:hypothetical protein
MSKFSGSIKEFINVAGLSTKIKALETELALLKQLQSSLGVKTRGRKPGVLLALRTMVLRPRRSNVVSAAR